MKLNNLEITEQLLIIEERKNGVEELAEKLEELYRSKIQEYIDHIGTKVKLVFDKNDDSYFSYFHCELNYENTLLVLRIQFDDDEKKKNYCQLETKPKNKKIPEEIVKDSAIYKELNDKNNKKNEIWSYDDSYEESLKRFDRVLGRLLEIINQK